MTAPSPFALSPVLRFFIRYFNKYTPRHTNYLFVGRFKTLLEMMVLHFFKGLPAAQVTIMLTIQIAFLCSLWHVPYDGEWNALLLS